MVNPIAKFTTYVRESVAELHKVTWPTREQTRNYTLLVLGLSVAIAIFFSVLDLGFNNLIEFII
ncbi:MAG: preprotein translocase subunit SecE [Patescibacteria group bacterium]